MKIDWTAAGKAIVAAGKAIITFLGAHWLNVLCFVVGVITGAKL